MTTINPPSGDILLTIIRMATHTCLLAAPYIKAPALQRLFEELAGDVSLTVVTRWLPHDVIVGASDPEAWLLTTQRGGTFLNHPHLHAKYYRADDNVLVGSANLTDTALGWAEMPNLEILTPPISEFDIGVFETGLLAAATPISDSQYQAFQDLPRRPLPAHQPYESISLPDLTSYRPHYHNLSVVFQTYESANASANLSASLVNAIDQDLTTLAIPPGLNIAEYRTFLRARLTASPFMVLVERTHFPQLPEFESTYHSIADRLQEDNFELRNQVTNAVQWIIWLNDTSG